MGNIFLFCAVKLNFYFILLWTLLMLGNAGTYIFKMAINPEYKVREVIIIFSSKKVFKSLDS